MDPLRWRKVLVVQTSFLGDTILTLPLISEIRRRFPTANITVLCSLQARELLAGHPDLDAVIVDDKKGVDRGLLGLWRKARSLRGEGFTMALSPHKSFRSGLLLALARIPFRVGFRESKGWFLFHARVKRNSARHDVERTLSILEAFDIRAEECRRDIRLGVDPRTQEAVDQVLRPLGISGERLVIALNPGSVWPTKRWAADGFAKLIGLLERKYSCEILLLGGPEDVAIVSKIRELAGSTGVSLAGKIALGQLPAVLRRCNVLITNDSGPMHVAVAQGIPIVAIFCATTPSLGFYPYSGKAIVVEKELPCRPCSSHGGRRCPLGTEDCIRLIRPEDVLRAVEQLLSDDRKIGAATTESYEPQFMRV